MAPLSLRVSDYFHKEFRACVKEVHSEEEALEYLKADIQYDLDLPDEEVEEALVLLQEEYEKEFQDG